RKGLNDFLTLREILPDNYDIVLVGLKDNINRPRGIKIIPRTEDVHQLAKLYSTADIFINPTYQDNFPTTNLEALACGTPVITYNTGGSPEAIDDETGIVVKKGDIAGLASAIKEII